jgi:hypothetical protein
MLAAPLGVALLVSGVSMVASPAPSVAGGSPVLRCARAWNGAALGDGRRRVPGVSASAAPALRGLLVRFADGVCGLVLSRAQADASGEEAVFLRVLDGDYGATLNPVGESATLAAETRALERRDGAHPNVTVDPRGRVVPDQRAALAVVPYPALAPAAAQAPCQTIFIPAFANPHGGGPDYRVVAQNRGCPVTREIVWAYLDDQGRPVKGKAGLARTVVGWHCASGPKRVRIRCVKGSGVIDVRAIAPHIAPTPG